MVYLVVKLYLFYIIVQGFPAASDSKESAYSAGDLGLISESGRSSVEGNGNPLQYSGLVKDREAWCVVVLGVTKSQTRLSD